MDIEKNFELLNTLIKEIEKLKEIKFIASEKYVKNLCKYQEDRIKILQNLVDTKKEIGDEIFDLMRDTELDQETIRMEIDKIMPYDEYFKLMNKYQSLNNSIVLLSYKIAPLLDRIEEEKSKRLFEIHRLNIKIDQCMRKLFNQIQEVKYEDNTLKAEFTELYNQIKNQFPEQKIDYKFSEVI